MSTPTYFQSCLDFLNEETKIRRSIMCFSFILRNMLKDPALPVKRKKYFKKLKIQKKIEKLKKSQIF